MHIRVKQQWIIMAPLLMTGIYRLVFWGGHHWEVVQIQNQIALAICKWQSSPLQRWEVEGGSLAPELAGNLLTPVIIWMRALAHAFTFVFLVFLEVFLVKEYVWLEKSCIFVNIKYFPNNAIDAVMVQIRLFLITWLLVNLYPQNNEHVKLVSSAEVRPRCISCWELVFACVFCFDVSIVMELWLKMFNWIILKYVLIAGLGRLKTSYFLRFFKEWGTLFRKTSGFRQEMQ